MKKQFEIKPVEYSELASAVDQLTQRAPTIGAEELSSLWPWVENQVLDRVHADETEAERRGFGGAKLRAEGQCIRNLAWEVAVSIDLGAVHLKALEALTEALRKRGRRFEKLAALRRSGERALSAS